jgi:multisubunit Na+/H+ antiporter MnhC subunit
MEKLLMCSAGYILALVGIVLAVTVGVMSILLPILVFRILSQMTAINNKLDAMITLLGEVTRGTSPSPSRRHGEDLLRSAPAWQKDPVPEDTGRSLRYK